MREGGRNQQDDAYLSHVNVCAWRVDLWVVGIKDSGVNAGSGGDGVTGIVGSNDICIRAVFASGTQTKFLAKWNQLVLMPEGVK